jgi:hypothetical protein
VAEKPYGPSPWQKSDEKSEVVRLTEARQRPLSKSTPVSETLATQDATQTGQGFPNQTLTQAERATFRDQFLGIPGPSKASRLPKRSPLISEEERARYTPESIAQQKKYESEMDRIERAVLNPLSPEFTSPELATPEARNIEGSAQINRIDAKNTLPISMRNDFESKQDFLISNYPTLYAAANNAGLSKEEIFDLTNLTLAVDAALTIATTRDDRRVREIIYSMAGPQAALTIDILNAMSAEAKKQDGTIGTRKLRKETQPDPDASMNPIANFIKSWAWDPSINLSGLPFIYPDTNWGPIQDGELYGGGKGVIDTLIAASDTAIRGTITLAGVSANARETGDPQLTNAWNATGAGQFDPTMIQQIRQNNDPLTVDIMLDLKKFSIMGDEDPHGSVYAKYSGDPRTERIMDQIMFNTDPNSEIAILSNEIDLSETGNIGNIIAWGASNTLGANAAEYESIRNLAQNRFVMSGIRLTTGGLTVALDPTLGLARFGQGVRVMKYGLAKVSKGQVGPLESGRLEKVFSTPGVRNHYDYVGQKFEEIRNTTKTKIVDGQEVTVADTAAQAQKFETLASQMRKWYDYNALQVMYQSGMKNADEAKDFLVDGTNINLLLSGQAAKRGKEFTAPHMTKSNAVWKAITFKARGLNPANMGGPREYLKTLYGFDLADDVDDEIAEKLIKLIDEDPQNAGRLLSDWAITGKDGVQRTLFGKIIKADPDSYKMRNRYGWRRKGVTTGDLGWFADRVGRLLARIPDTSLGAVVANPSDAKLVKQYIQSLGMSRHFANTVQFSWASLDETTRIRFINALNKSAIYSTGMDLVNPELADDLLRAFATAAKPGTRYAPDQIDVLAIRLQAERNVKRMDDLRRESNVAAFTPEERAGAVQEQMDMLITGVPKAQEGVAPSAAKGLSKEERRLAMRAEVIQGIEDAKINGRIYNPSALNATDNYALYDTQLSGRVALFNPQAMNQIMARQSYLNVLLGGGPKMTSFTDYWVLATLAGPRFVMRSGLEDFGLYAFTGGKFFGHDGWFMGSRASKAIRESIERVEPTIKPLIRGGNKGLALGIAATTRREIGTRLARRIPVMRGLILDYADPEEIAQATAMAAARGSEKSREGIANLFASMFARARFFSLNRVRYAKGEPLVLDGEAKQVADWLTDGVNRGYLNANMERAAETGQHLADGSIPAFRAPQLKSEVVDGVVLDYIDAAISPQRVKEVTVGYKTSWQAGARNSDDVENFYMELDTALYQDGAKGYIAIARSPQYYKVKSAMIRAEAGDDLDAISKAYENYNKFIDEYVEILESDPNIVRYVLAQELGMRDFAVRKLDDALRMMTTRTGGFNSKLYNKLKLPEGAIPARKGRVPAPDSERKFGLYYFDEAGNLKYNLSRDALQDPNLPMPQSVGSADSIPIVQADKLPFNTRAWTKMGRALARLTREPIYIANYADMRRLVEPFRLRMVDDLVKGGKGVDDATEMADDWAAKTAADKAYDLTMSYVDNPAVRSQLAWQVRNVARFYRALEDFNRRMVRVAENKPETFWKMALTWNVLDDSGFVWEDEFGDKYFLFPGTQVAFDAINRFASAIGVQPRVPSLPMTWGAKVSMLLPSTDPNALVPTLGAPFSAVTVKSLVRMLPSLPLLDSLARGLKDVPVAGDVSEFISSPQGSRAIEGALFGEYSVNQTFVSSIANDVLGPNLKRLFDAYEATAFGFESREAATGSFIAGASKRAIHAVVASGLYDPKKEYTEEEIEELRMIADITAVNETWLRLVLVPALIATPQPVSLTVSDVARSIGIDSGSALWLKYLNRYDSYNDAFLAFTKDNPGKAIFTISKYQSNDYYQMLTETENFIQSNMDEFKARPTGLSHFAPQEGTYGGLQSFYFMRANNIRVPNTVQTFFEKSVRAAGEAEVAWVEFIADSEREKTRDEEVLSRIDKAEINSKARIKADYPYSTYGVTMSLDRVPAFRRDADEIFKTAQYIIENNLDTDGRASKYVLAYNQYQAAEREMSRSAENKALRDQVREAWRRYIQGQAIRDFSGDDRGLRYLRILSGALNIEVEGL